MAKIKDYTNAELMFELIVAAFNVCKSGSKTASARLDKVEAEMAKRLQITDEELEHIRERM